MKGLKHPDHNITPSLSPSFLRCFRVNEIVNVAVLIVKGGGASGGATAMALEEIEGAIYLALLALLILGAVDLSVCTLREALAAPR